MVKQTPGREALGEFAPKFAELNDDVLFGEVWSREEELSLKVRSIITVTALVSKGLVDSSFEYHLKTARANGVTRAEMAEILTHIAFYAGWPNAWAAFRMAVTVYGEDVGATGASACVARDGEVPARAGDSLEPMFGLGTPNDAYARYFTGRSWLNALTCADAAGVAMSNVTFEPGCRNNWHIHHAEHGGGQVLLCTDGHGWYQEWGKPARALSPGDIVVIPAGVKHWHGAAADSWFAHIAYEIPGDRCSNEWLEPILDEDYHALA